MYMKYKYMYQEKKYFTFFGLIYIYIYDMSRLNSWPKEFKNNITKKAIFKDYKVETKEKRFTSSFIFWNYPLFGLETTLCLVWKLPFVWFGNYPLFGLETLVFTFHVSLKELLAWEASFA